MCRNMGRKGKEIAGSSSKQAETQPKKRRYLGRDDGSDEEEEIELDPADKPKWEVGPLDDQPEEWQPTLFNDHMNWLKDKAVAFICEREVREVEFVLFNVFSRFRALGWETALSCYDKDSKNLFKDEIQEWMATLRCNEYSKPSQMKLTGTVNSIDVEMSFDTLRKLAKYDSLPARDYMIPSLDDLLLNPEAHPRWNDMLEPLFLPNTFHGTLYRRNLKIEAKLLLMICIYNVIPRRGDKQEVRFPRCAHSLLFTSYVTPFPVMAITPEDKGAAKRHKPFDIRRMGVGWRALKVDTRALLPGEEDEPGSEDEPPSGDEDYADELHAEHMNVNQGGPTRGHAHGRGFFDYTERSYEPNWADQGTMQEIIENQRPPALVFDTWSGSECTFFDHQTWMGASMERALKHSFDRQESWNHTHAYAFEQEMNNKYIDDQNRRMHADWNAGRPVVVDPPPVDYALLSPYDGSVSYLTPPQHHSQRVDPRQDQQHGDPQQGGSGSGSGSFAFGEWSEMLTSIFGPPQLRYY
ncbi:hypothetical protein Hanom_Chr00s000002g01600491 [Helianthus anomalus]